MGLAEATIAFIVIGLPAIVIASIVDRTFRHREKKLELEARIAEADAARLSARDGKQEQRLRVLERIVTDKGLIVADEIEQLRDERPVS